MPFTATCMDPKIIILNEVKSQKDKYHKISLIAEYFKNYTNELIYKKETDLQT